MKTILLTIILVALILVACGGDGSDTKTEIKEPITLQESGIHRYIDTELGVACYTYSRTQVAFMMSCVLLDKTGD